MKQILSDHDRSELNTRIADVEKQTNSQIVLALIQRSDNYAELPWKAFALGASLIGLSVFIIDLFGYDWYPAMTVFTPVVGILGGGAVLALLTVLIPGYAKHFLSASRIEVEVRQYAESLFLSRELFSTSKRTGILVMVSLFERKVVILPDRGLGDQLPEGTLQNIIAAMAVALRQGKVRHAFETGLEQLSNTLEKKEPGIDENELSDDIIEEKGV